MLSAAAAHDSLSGGSLALVACFSALALGFGVAHYRGWHRAWLRIVPFEANFFTPAWFGAAGIWLTVAALVHHVSSVVGALLAIPAFACFVVMLMSFVWLPTRLLPPWYLEWRRRGRPPWELRQR